jgi:hypothetical protein
MRSNVTRSARWLISGTLLALVAGCSIIITPAIPGADRTDTKTIDIGGATSASVEVDLGTGELTLGGGSTGLATTTFTYNVERLKPTVDYTVKDSRGTLVIAQPKAPIAIGSGMHNQWDVKLSNTIPIDLKINTGAGKSDLNLRGLNLVSANVAGGAGELRADLSGSWKKSVQVTIAGGVGKISVLVPTSVGARVTVTTGLGSVTVNGLQKDGDSWVNAAYGTSPVTLDVTIKAGVGEVTLDAK